MFIQRGLAGAGGSGDRRVLARRISRSTAAGLDVSRPCGSGARGLWCGSAVLAGHSSRACIVPAGLVATRPPSPALQLTSQRVAAPAEQPRGLLPSAVSGLERLAITVRSNSGRAPSSSGVPRPQSVPAPSSRVPVPVAGRWCAGRSAAEVRRNVGARDLAAGGEHGQAAAGVDELAHVARPVERKQRGLGSGASTFGATPSSSAATSR